MTDEEKKELLAAARAVVDEFERGTADLKPCHTQVLRRLKEALPPPPKQIMTNYARFI